MLIELCLQRSDELPILFVDRTMAAEVVVVLRYGQHSLARNIFPTQHIFEEGNYLLVRFRPPKRHHQQRVIMHTSDCAWSCRRKTSSVRVSNRTLVPGRKNWREDFDVRI